MRAVGPRDPARRAQGQPAGWQREQRREAGPAGKLARERERAQDQQAGWQREQNRSRRAAARAVRSSGRPAGRRRCRGPQHVAAAVATCRSRSVTRAERELELRWSRPGRRRAGLKMPNTCGRELAMPSDSEPGGYRVLQRKEGRAENLSYQEETESRSIAAISNRQRGKDKGEKGRPSGEGGGYRLSVIMSVACTCDRPLVRRPRRGACRDPRSLVSTEEWSAVLRRGQTARLRRQASESRDAILQMAKVGCGAGRPRACWASESPRT